MPKKFSDIDKAKWLKFRESGMTEVSIAKKAECDLRTIRRGLEEAGRKQDVKLAKIELIKDALRKHQESLLEELDKILLSLIIPTDDYVPIHWQKGGDFILAEAETVAERWHTSESRAASRREDGAVRQLLRQHLKNDRLWRVLAQWKKAYDTHLEARLNLQRKTVNVIRDKTGCSLVDRNNVPRPFIWSYNTGDLFFRSILQQSSTSGEGIDLENNITANPTTGDVRWVSQVLAEAPGEEERVKSGLLAALRELKVSREATSVLETRKALEEAATKLREVVEQIKLLGLITGQCEICRRLGM